MCAVFDRVGDIEGRAGRRRGPNYSSTAPLSLGRDSIISATKRPLLLKFYRTRRDNSSAAPTSQTSTSPTTTRSDSREMCHLKRCKTCGKEHVRSKHSPLQATGLSPFPSDRLCPVRLRRSFEYAGRSDRYGQHPPQQVKTDGCWGWFSVLSWLEDVVRQTCICRSPATDNIPPGVANSIFCGSRSSKL